MNDDGFFLAQIQNFLFKVCKTASLRWPLFSGHADVPNHTPSKSVLTKGPHPFSGGKEF